MLGELPALSDHYYFEVGTDGCFEKTPLTNESLKLGLECPILNPIVSSSKNLSPAIPKPEVKWMLNGTIIYSGKAISEDYLLKGHEILMEAFISPMFVTAVSGGRKLEFNFQVENSTLLEALGLDVDWDRIYSLLDGSWTCMQSNIYGNNSASISLSQCGKHVAIAPLYCSTLFF